MTEQAQAQQPTQQQLEDALPLPTTRGELRHLIAHTIGQVFAVPDNANQFAQLIFAASIAALQQTSKIAKLQSGKAVLTRVEYPGCARATILEGATIGEYGVRLEERIEGEWAELKRDEWVITGLTTLVLSQATFPGDVFYVTTDAKVDEHQERLAEKLAQENPGTLAPAI